MKAHMVVMDRTGRRAAATNGSRATKESRSIAALLPVAIPLGRALGWSSERTYREAETWALRGGRVHRR
ncbi:MAG TPA: hypothetical protein VF072_13105 [Thermoleophilaceae bacterium]